MMQKKERNNKGFTLVELLVAISVLALIVVPFMQAFVTAARTNMKAKKMQNATILATNVMEELKANTMEELAFQFNYPLNRDGESRFDVMNTFTKAYELVTDVGGSFVPVVQYQENAGVNNESSVTSSVLYKDYRNQIKEEFEFLGQDSGKYYFALQGAEVENDKFDALITVDGNAYVNPSVSVDGYNEMKIPVIASPDELSDAFYIQKNNMDDKYAQEFLDTITNKTATSVKELFDGNYDNDEVGRLIEIDVEVFGAITSVKIAYTYTYYTGTNVNDRVVAGEKVLDDVVIYDNAEGQSQELKSVYLFYKPLYGAKISKKLEKIRINNLSNLPLNIYIVKQRQTTTDSVAMSVKEKEYYCEVELLDNSGINVGTKERSCMTLRTNLGENLYQDNDIINNQYILRYSTNAMVEPLYSPNNKEVLGLTGLNGEIQKDRIYEVNVAVYEEGQALAGFPGEEKPFIEITGSKGN